MYFKQFYLGCLAHASYLIGSQGEAAVIDPQRDIEQYLEEAEQEGLRIKYVFETHLHADFVSGHVELAERTGAKIVFGKEAKAKFNHIAAKDGDVFRVGALHFRVLETPGHTPESICVVVTDRNAAVAPILFSGDTLFIGDVGRPDLVAAKGFTAEQMARMMYHSLHDKLLKLPDETEVWPAHGAGSLCGKQLSNERSSTLGLQKKFNYALKDVPEDQFVKLLTENQPEVPQYFPKDVQLNWEGPRILAGTSRPAALSVQELNAQQQQSQAIVLDVRSGEDFALQHIPRSLNIPLSGQFASWAGSLIALGTPIVLVATSEPAVDEAITRLARVGIESVVGYLRDGIHACYAADTNEPMRRFGYISVDQLHHELETGRKSFLLDVRRRLEHETGHVPKAVNIPLVELPTRIGELPSQKEITVICASGYRSSIAASILEGAGFTNIRNVAGGTNAWRSADYQIEQTERVSA